MAEEQDTSLILKRLRELQEVDTQRKDIMMSKNLLPQRLEELEDEIENTAVALNKSKEEDVELTKKIKELELELSDLENKLSVSQKRLLTVKSNKEYDAVQREIDKLEEKKAICEEQILELMEKQENLSKRKANLQEKLKKVNTENRDHIKKIKQNLENLDKLLVSIDAKRANIIKSIPNKVFKRYQRIKKSGAGRVVVKVVNGVCGGCSAVIPPQVIQEIKRGNKIISCENCGRFLLWDES